MCGVRKWELRATEKRKSYRSKGRDLLTGFTGMAAYGNVYCKLCMRVKRGLKWCFLLTRVPVKRVKRASTVFSFIFFHTFRNCR